MTKKCKRTWSYEKFRKSCIANAKRLNVKVTADRLRKAYDDNWSVLYTVDTLSVPAKVKKAA